MATQVSTRSSDRPLRRVPVQGRSVARVARMLDACAELLDEVGYDALTTTHLAERAGVAIGSVYQFFPDKRAVVQALTVRNIEGYLDRVGTMLSGGEFSHWWEAVSAAIDEYIAMHRNVPGFRTLQFSDIGDEHLLDEVRDNATVIADHIADHVREYLRGQLTEAGEPALRLAFAVVVEITDALARMAFRREPDGDPAVLSECKALVKEYLERRLG